MKCRFTLASVGLVAGLLFNQSAAQAQDIHFTQFDASPLTLNPANTGAFNGEFRASAIYRDQWRSVLNASAFKTFAFTFDMPIIRDISVDDYLAAGAVVYNDRAGDGNLNNMSVMLSVAYHKFLGTNANKVLTVGLQGGYSQKNIDLSKLYFGDEFQEGSWQSGTSAEFGWLGPKTSGFLVNVGINYAQSIGSRSGFSVGVGVNNLNQPLESFDDRQSRSDVGLGMRYTAQLGGIIGAGERFFLRPAVLLQSQSTSMEIIAGNEFLYRLGADPDLPNAPAIFAGGWYRLEDAAMITVGVEFKGFRIGVGYDYNISDLRTSTNGNGGFEISLRYIAPSPLDFARRLLYPCSRF